MWAAYSSARRHGDTRISMLRSQWQCYLRAHILAECWPVAVASSAERTAKDGWVECVCRMLRPIRFVQVFVVDACSIHVVGRDIYHRESKGICDDCLRHRNLPDRVLSSSKRLDAVKESLSLALTPSTLVSSGTFWVL